MKIFAPKETDPDESRAALDPVGTKKLVALGTDVIIESGAGEPSGHADEEYRQAGAEIASDRKAALADADMVVRVRKPPADRVCGWRAVSARGSGCGRYQRYPRPPAHHDPQWVSASL